MTDNKKQEIVAEFDELSSILDAIHSSEQKNWYQRDSQHLDFLRKNGALNEKQYYELIGQLRYQAQSLIIQLLKKKG